MNRRLFEDLVVSAPPSGRFGRRAALLPLSIAAHGAALALALLVPVLRSGDLPTPTGPIDIWVPPPPIAPPPPMATPPPPPRVTGVAPAPISRPTMPAEPVEPPPAPGPTVSMIEPDILPTDEGRAPCLLNCEGQRPDGIGDGTRGAPSTTGVSDGTGTSLVRPGGDIKAPVRTAYVAPIYPDIARAAGVGGTVVLECTIDPSGHVVDARVISGHPLLNEAALNAVRQWRYTATRLNGVPVAVLMTVTVRFIPHR
jgi:periplasmic protein TonB